MSFGSFLQWVRRSKMMQLTYLTFYYTTGTDINASVNYALTEQEGRYTAVICPRGVSAEHAIVTEVGENFVTEVTSVLLQYHVGRWNGFDRSRKNVLDGNSFTLNAGFTSGKSIHAHGYMWWPKHFRAVRDALDACFMRLYLPSSQ